MMKPSNTEIRDAINMAFEARAITEILSSCMDREAEDARYEQSTFHVFSRANDAAGRLMVKVADVLDRMID